MNVLVTGATGFLGSALLKQLKNDSNKSDNIYVLSSKPIDGFSYILHRNYTYGRRDLPEHIDMVLCLGGFVPKNPEDQKDGYKHASAVFNIHHLLNNLPNIPEKIVFCSSTEVYGRNNSILITEETAAAPYDLYSAQKYMCEGIVRNYSKENNTQYQILRLGPMFGPGDKRRNVFLPGIIYLAAENKPIELTVPYGTRRNYMYVYDTAAAIWEVAHCNYRIPVINIVSQNNIAMGKIAESVIQAINSDSKLVLKSPEDGHKDELLFDNKALRQYVNIREHPFITAIIETYKSMEV